MAEDFELAPGVASLPRSEWDGLVATESPFLEWEWLASLEESGAVDPSRGWQACPLIARHEGRLIAACPLYVKSHSEGEFVFDWSWADAAERAGIRYYPKLLVGVPFTPVSGARLLVAPGADRAYWQRRLAEALRAICVSNEFSGVHVNFCRESEARELCEHDYLLRIGLQYQWHNRGYTTFEDYLADFRSKRRNQIRRELRELERQHVEIEVFAGERISDALFESMYDFYISTIDNHYWGRRYLDFRFFELLRDRFRQRLVFLIAKRGDEVLAGTFNVAKGDALFGRYWGTTHPMRHLHFNLCYYAAVRYCIESGLQRFEPGAGGEYKQPRGFDAAATFSAHFLSDPRLARAVAHYLEGERDEAGETLDWYRERTAFKKRDG